jgi:hypothetical protein
MKYWREHWWWIGGIIFVALAFFMGFYGVDHLEHVQTIMVFSWMAMLVHQVEEYGWPGGFAGYANILMMGEKEDYDHYPFNPMLCFFDNVFTCYAFYIIPIFFPHVMWLVIAQACSGSLQVLAHCIMQPIRTGRLYNPGGAVSLFIQLPLAVYTMWYLTTNGMVTSMDIILGWLGAVAGLALVFGVPVVTMKDRNSKYHFPQDQVFGAIPAAEKQMKEVLASK